MSEAAGGRRRQLTLGTAGHIDHGKTTLIKALTGKDTDRLKEEKERGISIELGFAELVLPSGLHLSVVDVPGHERFVKTMVAGATGIDLFLLVVAADDGVMPQTREHVRVIELLDVSWGVVAVTKIDAVERDLVELATADVEDLLRSTRYEGVPVIPVSGVTGEGMDILLEALEDAAGQVRERTVYPATRLPIDRVFSLRGAGTVVTGTLWSGELRAGDVVSVLPRAQGRGDDAAEVRIRTLQSHDREVEAGCGGQRLALNLSGVERQEVVRGQWVVKRPTVKPTFLADVRIRVIAEAPGPLQRVSRVRVEHGTAEFLAKLVLVDRDRAEPGGEAYGQLRFETPALLYPGDRFVLRSVTPVTTVGGGWVVDHAPRKHGPGPNWRERLATLDVGPGEKIVAQVVAEAFPAGVLRAEMEGSPYLWRLDGRASVEGALMRGSVQAVKMTPGAAREAELLFDVARLVELKARVLQILRENAKVDPANPYMPLGELRRQVAGGRQSAALQASLLLLEAGGEVVRSEHGVRWAGAEATLQGADAEAAERLLAAMA